MMDVSEGIDVSSAIRGLTPRTTGVLVVRRWDTPRLNVLS